MEDILAERKGDVIWITLNRPERLNSYGRQTIDEIVLVLRENMDARVGVITGNGRAFCAGGYLGNLAEADFWNVRSMFVGSLELFDAIRNAPFPIIAAVNGGAFGGGNELVVMCDLAIAGESAQLGQTGVKVGSAPVLGGTNLLAMTVGEKRAKEVSFLCRKYSAEEAYELGWINKVVPDEMLHQEVEMWCDEIIQMSPRYLEVAKASSNVMYHQMRDNMVNSLGALIQAIGAPDMLEGANSFMEKRKPQFPPRSGLGNQDDN